MQRCIVSVRRILGLLGVKPGNSSKSAQCVAEMEAVCPLQRFENYSGCRSCLKVIENTNGGKQLGSAGQQLQTSFACTAARFHTSESQH